MVVLSKCLDVGDNREQLEPQIYSDKYIYVVCTMNLMGLSLAAELVPRHILGLVSKGTSMVYKHDCIE